LPYKVITSGGNPFSGSCNCSTIQGLGSNSIYVNAYPNSYQGQIWKTNGVGSPDWIDVAPLGRIIGHIRYLGVSDE